MLVAGIEAGLRNASERVARRYADRLRVVPAGVPVTPVPGYWYATVNAWTVEVRGRYARFVARAAGGTPADAPNATVAYVREDARATLDVDGDDEPEVFGHSTPVSFRVRTAVVVVVPPGGSGVGDRVGDAVQASPGWPTPGRVEAPYTVGSYDRSCCTTNSRTPRGPRPRTSGRATSANSPT
jgi:hypothetical protein